MEGLNPRRGAAMTVRRIRMSEEEAARLLRKGRLGVLSTVSAADVPYGVPLNYVYVEEERALYFQGAPRGRKMDNIRANSRASL